MRAVIEMDSLHDLIFGKQSKVESDLEEKQERERRDAAAQIRDAEIYRTMPEDLRSRAREWRLEAFMCAVWSNAWHAGYRQCIRDRATIDAGTDHADPS